MRGRGVVFKQPGKGGVNLVDAPYVLRADEARDARNVVSSTRGVIKKRDGSTLLATMAANLTSLFASLNPAFLIGSAGTSLYSVTSAGAIATIGTGLTAGRWEFINGAANGGQGPIYGSNGVEVRQWTGVGSVAAWTASTGTLPVPKFLLYRNRRVWAAGMSAYTTLVDPASALVFSNVGNPRDWPAANVVEFDPSDGEAISGLGAVASSVLVFKPSKAWVVYDLDTGANRPLGGGVGCIAHRSIVETPGGTFFLSKDHGVMVTDGSTAKRISDRVQPLLKTLSSAQQQAACATFFDDRYLLAFSVGGVYNDTLLDYDTRLDAWWIHTIAAQDLTTWDVAGDARLYAARGNATPVDRLFVPGALNDSGTTFSCYWNGPFHEFDTPAIRKRMRHMRYDARGRVQVTITRDFAPVGELLSDTVVSSDGYTFGTGGTGLFGVSDAPVQYFGGNALVATAKVPTPGVARAFSIQFGNTTAEAMEVDSYTLAVIARKD